MGQNRKTLAFAFICLSTLGGLLWLIYLFLNSPGVPVHDELLHYFIARDAWHAPGNILDIWGRAANTLLYMPGAWFSHAGARINSIVMAFATALLTLYLARKLDAKYLFLVPLFLWFQPWYCDLSYACITEVPFSFVMVAAMCLLASEHLAPAALLIGLLPLIRHEGIAFSGLIAVWALYRRNWPAALAAFVPLIIYNVVCYAVGGSWPLTVYLEPKPTEFYGAGQWQHFVLPLVAGAGLPLLFLAANAFVPALLSTPRRLVFAFYLAYFLLHAVVYRFGLFASGGYGLFLLPLAPGIATAAAIGLESLVAQGEPLLASRGASVRAQRWARNGFIAAVAVTVLIVGFDTKPRLLTPEEAMIKQVVDWLRGNGLDKGRIVTTHPFMHLYLPEVTNRAPDLPEDAKRLNSFKKGTIVVWDFHYSERWGLKLEDIDKRPDLWETLQRLRDGQRDILVIFRKRVD